MRLVQANVTTMIKYRCPKGYTGVLIPLAEELIKCEDEVSLGLTLVKIHLLDRKYDIYFLSLFAECISAINFA